MQPNPGGSGNPGNNGGLGGSGSSGGTGDGGSQEPDINTGDGSGTVTPSEPEEPDNPDNGSDGKVDHLTPTQPGDGDGDTEPSEPEPTEPEPSEPEVTKDPALNPDDGSTPASGDIYKYGEYTYTYNASSGGWAVSLNLEVTNKSKTSYGPILESINGEPVTNMESRCNC